MLLDIQAARAVAQAKLFEKAVHDPGPWSIRIGDQEEWAIRARTSSGVIFIAHFEPGAAGDVAWLLCGGVEISSKDLVIDDGGAGFSLEWKLSLSQVQPVSV